MTKDIDEKQAEKTARAKRADLVAANERFAGILRVCENRDDDGTLSPFKIGIITMIARGQSLEQVALDEGWRQLGMEAADND